MTKKAAQSLVMPLTKLLPQKRRKQMDELKIAAAIIYSKMIKKDVTPNDDMGEVGDHYWRIVEALHAKIPEKYKKQNS